MTDNLSPDNRPIPSDQAKSTDQPISTPPSPEKKAILETPPASTPIPQIATPPAATIPPAASVPDKKAIVETPSQGTPIPQIATPPAAETIPNKNSVGAIADTPAPVPASTEPPAVVLPMPDYAAALPDIENPYILSGEIDRARLVAQTKLFRGYIEKNAKQFIGEDIKSILDIGCGEGQLSLALAHVFPDARIVGIDRDEKAIEVARRNTRGLSNLEFKAGDATENLPSEPFDLIYISLVLSHLVAAPKMLQSIHEVLKPGGHLWVKEIDRRQAEAFDDPAPKRVWATLENMMTKIGGNMYIGMQLHELLKTMGFSDIAVHEESYDFGKDSTEGRIVMSVGFAVLYNARKMINKVLQIPESELIDLHKKTIDHVMAPGTPSARVYFRNIVARRPVQPVVVTPLPVETPALVVPESAVALPELENPYLLSGDIDRARLVAQSKFFRAYIEKHAKEFLGENIKSILDIGCAEGRLTQVFAHLYPDAQVLGVDKDEKAIETAKLAAKGLPNIRFEVCDLLQSLPLGPFDLVYESIVLQHIPGTAKIIKAVYDVLKPGGHLWMKEMHHNFVTAIDHPAYRRMVNWLVVTMEKFGTPYKLLEELPSILATTGFGNVRTETEIVPAGNKDTQARIVFSINVGAIYNARKPMSKIAQVTEAEIENTYRELVGAMLAGGAQGEYRYVNTIAQRPVQPVAVTPPQPETLALEVPASVASDITSTPAATAAPSITAPEQTAVPNIEKPDTKTSP